MQYNIIKFVGHDREGFQMTISEVIEVLEMQEEILQFSHFTNADAWTLGNMLVAEAQRRGVFPVISIRLNNGFYRVSIRIRQYKSL